MPRLPSQHRGTCRRCGRAIDAKQSSTPGFFSQKSVTTRAFHSAEDWRRHALFMAKPSKVSSRTERARVALAWAWMQLLKLVAGLQVRSASGRDEAPHDVRESGLRGGQGGLAGVGAGHVPEKDPRRFSTSSRVAASCRILAVVAQPFSDVTWRVRTGAARARRRLFCPRARSAPACPAGHNPCCRRS